MPIVNEFREVFPKDLPRLPPKRDIEFEIELVTNMEPILKAS